MASSKAYELETGWVVDQIQERAADRYEGLPPFVA